MLPAWQSLPQHCLVSPVKEGVGFPTKSAFSEFKLDSKEERQCSVVFGFSKSSTTSLSNVAQLVNPLVQGQPEPPPGPLLARFRNLGGLSEGQLVAGPWGDLSPHFHQLLKLFAESRVAAMGRAQGREAGGMLG